MRTVNFFLRGANILFVLVLLSLLVLSPSLSILEGRLFPVVTDVVVTQTGQTPGGTPIFDTAFTKSRNCAFDHIAWYGPGGELAGLRLPSASPNQPPVNRVAGKQVSKGWRIMNFRDLELTLAVVYHRCHVFWPTRTLFWKGSLAPPLNKLF